MDYSFHDFTMMVINSTYLLTVACKDTRHLGIFLTRDFELSKSCSNLTLLAPNKGGFEVSKKVQYVSVAQWAAKLQLVKLGVIFHKV